MTHAVTMAGRRAGTLTLPRSTRTTPTTTSAVSEDLAIARQAAIENALSTALYFVRQPGDAAANIWAATARANRALTLLKQAGQALPLTTGRG